MNTHCTPLWTGLAVILMASGACSDTGGEADDVVGACQRSALIDQCPPGSNPLLGIEAETACQDAVGGVLFDDDGAAIGNCAGPTRCLVRCQWSSPCLCGVESFTNDGITCMPCDPDRGCGNGVCDPGEDDQTCAIDCGVECQPGERRCNAAAVQECNLQGRFEEIACPNGEVCVEDGVTVECKVDVIDPNPGMDPNPDPGPGMVGCGDGVCDTITETQKSCTQDCLFRDGDTPWPGGGDVTRPGDLRGIETLYNTGGFALPGQPIAGFSPDAPGSIALFTDGARILVPRTLPGPTTLCDAQRACTGNNTPPCTLDYRAMIEEGRPALLGCLFDLYASDTCGDTEAVSAGRAACLESPGDLFDRLDYTFDNGVGIQSPVRASADARFVLAGSLLGLGVLDQETGETFSSPTLGDYRPILDPVTRYAMSADGQTVVMQVIQGLDEEAMMVWNPQSGEARLAFPNVPEVNNARHVLLSPNGRVLVAANGGALGFWDIEQEALIMAYVPIAPQNFAVAMGSMAFSPNGGVFAILDFDGNGGPVARVVNLAERTIIRDLPVSSQTNTVVFSPDGTVLVTSLAFWDLETGRSFYNLTDGRLETPPVVSPDGRYLINDRLFLGP